MEKSKYLRVDQVAVRLNCSREFVYKLMKNQRMPHVKIGNQRGYRILEADLNNFIISNRKGK
ncbi:MAG: excisionase family DNA-binding protein [Syntrophaceae bacterium]|nr:excisionase family DNA-binding protein [Syntrophaceae bacterium]